MPLSEQEQRLLDEMERHLLHNDADIVSAPSGDRTLSYRNLVYGAVLLLIGIGALVAGVALGGQLGATVGRRLPPPLLRAVIALVGITALVALLV